VLTGNAFDSPGQFTEHLLYLAAMVTVMGGLYVRTQGLIPFCNPARARHTPQHGSG